jgi:hypothetical protein
MGYETRYNLVILSGDTHRNDGEPIISVLKNECEYANFALYDNGVCRESAKWYEHEADMAKFSKQYPDTLFMLSGEGDDSDDLWRMYCKNGKTQKCRAVISYEPMDETIFSNP